MITDAKDMYTNIIHPEDIQSNEENIIAYRLLHIPYTYLEMCIDY